MFIIPACNSQENNTIVSGNPVQIGNYVVDTFEDSKGNLCFATLEKGLAIYDGKSLKYLTIADGLPSNRIVSIIEDSIGNLWLGTGYGLSKYDGKSFRNYSTEDGLCNNSISNLLIDSKGRFWIGSWGGVCQFDGKEFSSFFIPYQSVDTPINKDTEKWITEIMEDSKGNIWFGSDAFGATKYDGKEFMHFTNKDGLYSNNVQSIAEDNEGNIWIGTRVAEKDNPDPDKRTGKGGLNKFNGEKFIHFPTIDGLNENDVYEIYKDNSGHLWISTLSNGVYKYENDAFKNYKVAVPVMSVLKDKSATIWLGCAGGLYRINSKGIVNVGTNGPWN
jgi:ligand-binding sensor domain-containing protein